MLDRAVFLRPIAHRGLHNANAGIVENTGPAFEAAIAKGYAIECDVRPVAGGLPIVFHDQSLDRLVGLDRLVAKVKARELAGLQHSLSAAPILTLAGLLDLVGGRVPLLIEIKSAWRPPGKAFLSEIARLVSAYNGPVALMSFDPAVMAKIRILSPNIPRGIVSGSYADLETRTHRVGPKRAAALRNLLESGPTAPDFYAYDVDALPTPVTEYVRTVAHLPMLAWTVRTPRQRRIAAKWADAMIFEGFEP
jgi:glycerophosphoryl diester phosphodiesterase